MNADQPPQHPPDAAHQNHPPHDHEHSDVSVPDILRVAGGLAALIVVTLLVVAWLFWIFKSGEDRIRGSRFPLAQEERSKGMTLPPPPRLEGIEQRTPQGGEIARGVSRPEDALRYRWVDEEKQIVGVPIEVAFQRLLKNPPKAQANRSWQDAAPRMPSDTSSGRFVTSPQHGGGQ